MTVDASESTCPRCQAEAPSEARFCMQCGQALGGSSVEDSARQARLTATAPPPLVEKMRAARLSGERKPVTALFADVVGSTALAESMDPEDWTQLINGAFDLMSQAVFRYEGTIAQLQGDAMLAFFGAPVAHEDDPDRAVRAALEMVASIDEFARQLRQAQRIELRIRAGINTGPVVVGNVGTDLRYEYTALGDAVNTASRIQAAGRPGEVLITDSTRRLLGDAFDLEDLGELELRGKAEPVPAFRVTRARPDAVRRRGLAAVGLDSPMVGRDAQLALLRRQLAAVEPDRGRACLVIGEPGIGKSRLLAEFRALPASDGGAPPTWIEGRCVSYGQNLPYHLLIDLVRSMLGIPLQSAPAEARVTLDAELAALVGDDEATDVAPYLAHLLGLPPRSEEVDRTRVEPETMQGRYAASVHRLLRAHAARGPTVLVFEDLHWADPSSVKVIGELLALAALHPVLVIGALRDEPAAPGWEFVTIVRGRYGDRLSELRLEPLAEGDSRSLVANLLAIESLPNAVREAILARAGGNPFFVEEVVRMLIGRGLIERRDDRWTATAEVATVEIPETLHGLLLARIDQLPDDAKRSLRVASVIGRQFGVRVLERVLGEAEGEAHGEAQGEPSGQERE